jgi:competence protein ComEA
MIKLKRNSFFLIAVCTIALIFSVSFIKNFDNSEARQDHFQLMIEEKQTENIAEIEMEKVKIVVDVKGAVLQPGVYEMELGDRVVHAIEKASGFLSEANKDAINLALLLVDEMVIYVPILGEEGELQQISTTLQKSKDNGKININLATIEELQKIPGIGPAKASAIINYRDEIGKFKSVEELTNVTGIGMKTVEKMVEFIEVK